MDWILALNTIRANNSQGYQERIPVATKENFAEVGKKIMSFEADTNEFLSALVNRIGFVEASNRRFKNPLAVLKTGGMPFGTTIEEIYTNPVTAKSYDANEVGDLLTIEKPDVKTIYHEKNREDKYPVSINMVKLQEAFTSPESLKSFYETSVLNAMYSGDEMDEFLLMKKTVSSAIAEGRIVTMDIEWDGEEQTSKNLVKVLKTLAGDFLFPKTCFNGYNALNAEKIGAKEMTEAITWTPAANQIILVRTDVDAATDVEVLAKAFNMEKTDFLKRKFVVDDFGDEDTLCMICDENIFKFKDTFYQVRSFNNGSNLTQKWWLHHHQLLSLSLFGNAVAIKKKAAAEAASVEDETGEAGEAGEE